MTWGQLRFQLQRSAPGVDLDLLDEFLNVRYTQVLQANDWQGLKAHATVETTVAYQSSTDTVTLTVGSATVTGSGTAWTSGRVGERFYRPGDTAIYTVSAVASGTSLTIDRTYEGPTGEDATGTAYAGAAYVFMQNVYPLPSDCRSVVSVQEPFTGVPLTEISKEDLDRSVGSRAMLDNPHVYALYDDTAETSPPVLHQIEFYPPPTYARGYQIEYLRSATAWDGSSSTTSPLPWVTDGVLLYGCRADIAAYRAVQSPGQASVFMAQARAYESKFAEELNRIIRVEYQQRRQAPTIRIADRFTRHRLARVVRSHISRWGLGAGGPN